MAVGERIIRNLNSLYTDFVVLDDPEYGGRGVLNPKAKHPVVEVAQPEKKPTDASPIPGRTGFLP